MTPQAHAMQDAIIYFANKTYIKCKSFGASGTQVAEVIFNTSMTGYQEIASDPSYAGQFVTFCMPEIGNVGCNANDMESQGMYASGLIVASYNHIYSNFRAEESLEDFLRRQDKMGICDVDTRSIVAMLREKGSMFAVISTQEFDLNRLDAMVQSRTPMQATNFNAQVSTTTPYVFDEGVWNPIKLAYEKPVHQAPKKIFAIDFGIKRNILRELVQVGFEVEVLPWDFDPKMIVDAFHAKSIGGVFLSNGPGDPVGVKDDLTPRIRPLIDAKIPLFGICFGHQILSIVNGFDTYKMPFGHHGGNHPIMDDQGKVEITAQNHIYNVPEDITKVAKVIARNLFDDTIEGVLYNDYPILSIQYHPESSPGPSDSKRYFRYFEQMVVQGT